MTERGLIHHLELWVADLATAESTVGWLLQQLGYSLESRWELGQSWQLGETYIVLESGPDVSPERHDRTLPGMNHLTFFAGTPSDVETLTSDAQSHGWALMFSDRHPHAGGPGHYAAYLENADGFEIELVAG